MLVVIDYKAIVLKNKTLLKTFIQKLEPVPTTKGACLGLVLTLSKDALKHLDGLSPGLPKIKFLNDIVFTNHAWVFFDKKRKMCELFDATPSIIEFAIFPTGYSHWIGVDLTDRNSDDKISCCVDHGYGHPYMSKTSPLGFEFQEHRLCMTKLDSDKQSDNDQSRLIETYYVIEQFVNNYEKNCDLKLQLSK
jgi:hypothetical protein